MKIYTIIPIGLATLASCITDSTQTQTNEVPSQVNLEIVSSDPNGDLLIEPLSLPVLPPRDPSDKTWRLDHTCDDPLPLTGNVESMRAASIDDFAGFHCKVTWVMSDGTVVSGGLIGWAPPWYIDESTTPDMVELGGPLMDEWVPLMIEGVCVECRQDPSAESARPVPSDAENTGSENDGEDGGSSQDGGREDEVSVEEPSGGQIESEDEKSSDAGEIGSENVEENRGDKSDQVTLELITSYPNGNTLIEPIALPILPRRNSSDTSSTNTCTDPLPLRNFVTSIRASSLESMAKIGCEVTWVLSDGSVVQGKPIGSSAPWMVDESPVPEHAGEGGRVEVNGVCVVCTNEDRWVEPEGSGSVDAGEGDVEKGDVEGVASSPKSGIVGRGSRIALLGFLVAVFLI